MPVTSEIAKQNGMKGGRPRGSFSGKRIKAEKLREHFINEVAKHANELIPSLLDSAKGLFKEEIDRNGKVRIYQKEPDVNATKYLFDQGIGRPTETVKLQADMTLKIDI